MSTDIKFYSAWQYGIGDVTSVSMPDFLHDISVASDMHFVYLAPEETTFGAGIMESNQSDRVVNTIREAVEKRNVKITVIIGKRPEDVRRPAITSLLDSDNLYACNEKDVLTEIVDIVDVVCWPEFFMFWSPQQFMRTMKSEATVWPYGILDRPRKINGLFTLFNGIPHGHRCILMDELARIDLIDTNFVTWTQINDDYRFRFWDQEIIPDEHARYDLHGNIDQFSNQNSRYWKTLLDVVPESNSINVVWTEKTVRPLINFKPFVILGAESANIGLRKLGFELYDEIFDYSFDTLETARLRAIALAEQLQNLQNTHGPDGYNKIYEQVKPKLIHNAKVLCDIMSGEHRPVPEIVDQVIYYTNSLKENPRWIENFNNCLGETHGR